MNLYQVGIYLAIAGMATIIVVLTVPRQKRNRLFEIVLWIATGVVAFLCALLASSAGQLSILSVLSGYSFQNVPILPAAIGAFGGALILNVPLWFLDRMDNREPAEDERPDSD